MSETSLAKEFPMQPFTEADLTATMLAAAGPPALQFDSAAFLDASFDDLGYDSLAVMETVSLLKVNRGLELPDDAATRAGTPRELLALVTDALAAKRQRSSVDWT